MMEQKKLSRPNKLGELFLFQISYVLPGEYGGRHLLEACTRHVSVHALLAECDSVRLQNRKANERFQSTHSLRSATQSPFFKAPAWTFQSTHSLRSATEIYAAETTRTWFQSTHSLRSATKFVTGNRSFILFQSTHSLRSATPACSNKRMSRRVSIHALLAECDRKKRQV